MHFRRENLEIVVTDKKPYGKEIKSVEPIVVYYSRGREQKEILLEPGKTYQILIEKPTTKQEKARNNRIVEVLGFSDIMFADVIIKYKDNNRIGRCAPSCLLPYEDID